MTTECEGEVIRLPLDRSRSCGFVKYSLQGEQIERGMFTL